MRQNIQKIFKKKKFPSVAQQRHRPQCIASKGMYDNP